MDQLHWTCHQRTAVSSINPDVWEDTTQSIEITLSVIVTVVRVSLHFHSGKHGKPTKIAASGIDVNAA
jgi:hypothetical protein